MERIQAIAQNVSDMAIRMEQILKKTNIPARGEYLIYVWVARTEHFLAANDIVGFRYNQTGISNHIKWRQLETNT